MHATARTFVAAAFALTTGLTAAAARAEWVQVDERDVVTLDVHADERVTTTITARDRTPIQTCVGPCSVRVVRGSYRVHVEGEGFPSRSARIEADRPTRIEVEPGSSGGRWGGLGLGITGSATFAVGFFGLILSNMCIDNCSNHGDSNTAFLGVMGVGAALATVGWVMFGTNATHLEVVKGARISRQPLAFGVAPTKGGAIAAVGVAF